jgi:DNA-binding NtrC family response regulator
MTMDGIALDYPPVVDAYEHFVEEQGYREGRCHPEGGFQEIIGASAALTGVLQQVALVAPTDAAVLLQGETGTGKELLTRAIHQRSARCDSALVTVNCAAMPAGLLESELFGHERGAFTGALTRTLGRFELAHQGTLFLDEVGDLPLELQPKLLRVLQEQAFERVGGTRTIGVNVRLVAATHRDLAQMVAAGTFRSDLYYRLNVFPIHIPPLRERPEDIPLLVRHFTHQYARRLHKPTPTIPAEVLMALVRCPWPGNVRELQNVVERAVILSHDGILRPMLPEWPRSGEPCPTEGTMLEDVQREYILQVLRGTRWVVGGPDGAAARLGLKRTTLLSKMARLGIARQARWRHADACRTFSSPSCGSALGEAFALVRKSGVEVHQFLDIINAALFKSPIYETYGSIIADERYEPAGFKLALGSKDVRLALEAADAAATPMPLASLIRDHFLSAMAHGRGETDWAGLARVIAENAGLGEPKARPQAMAH